MTDEVARPVNHYDSRDIVRREAVILAGPIKVAAYRVRDPETGEFSALQFHSTFDNTIVALMGEQAAIMFARFVEDTLGVGATRPEIAALRRQRDDYEKMLLAAGVSQATLDAVRKGAVAEPKVVE